MDQLQDIISDIRKENCVLIIGPDIIDCGEKSFFENMCDELISDSQYKNIIDFAPQYIFVNEELLQLMPDARETTLLRMMERFYQKQAEFDLPLTKISQIPFHLIISLMPDDRLQRIFKEQGFDFCYSHYPREEPPPPVEKPTQKKPLIYNLLGDFNESDAIITFDHLFAFLSGIMGKRELPSAIQETLKKSRTFIFLGVHFEKWYVQLLLRIITSRAAEKFTLLKNKGNNDLCTFIARRLKLDFLEADPLQFLDAVYDECKIQNALKSSEAGNKKIKLFISYSHYDMETAKKLEKFLSKNDIDVIFDENNMDPGQKIQDFINVINTVDIVVPLISEKSLLSTWVSKEITITLKNKRSNQLVPCYLDKDFLSEEFVEKAEKVVDEKLKSIDEKIRQRGKINADDLYKERKNLIEYYNNLPIILTELNDRKCIPVMENDFDHSKIILLERVRKIAKEANE